MIISLSSLFSIILHSLLLLYRNCYKAKHTIIKTKTQNIIERFETQNYLSHKPNEIKKRKEKKKKKTHLGHVLLAIGRRTSGCGGKANQEDEDDLTLCLVWRIFVGLCSPLSLSLSFWVSACVHPGFSWPQAVRGHHTLGPWRHDSWVIVSRVGCVCVWIPFSYFIFKSCNQPLVLY